ncbi:glycoside hydrolase family 20 zincin-like fold domain-containing protein [Sphingomonas hankookensis]|uniref:glycoside hydrolase family 20 zincin-like fold domain-containing protein n=1 Tax=Sphingomonas hankookensis TaxID=563996 RepID=UPI003D3018D0
MDRIFNGKQRFGAAVLGLLLPTAALAGPVALMPQPRSVAPGVGGALSVAGPFAVRWTDCGGTPTLDRAAARLRDDVQRQTGLVLDPARAVPVRVTCRSTGAAADAGEGYRLTVATDGIAIDADGPTGACARWRRCANSSACRRPASLSRCRRSRTARAFHGAG